MNIEQNISDYEANLLIEQYLQSKIQEVIGEPITIDIAPAEYNYVDIATYLNRKAEKEKLKGRDFEGAKFETSIILKNKRAGKHELNRKIIECMDTRGIEARDFVLLLHELIYYKAYDKIEMHIESIVANPRRSLKHTHCFIKLSFHKFSFTDAQHRAKVIEVLKIQGRI
ncbi:MAG: hypothetical protein JEZ09_14485 [Salinivirgaceae bacterium]|nr:hypothetical protein [Salinivirgaceae bacterium]